MRIEPLRRDGMIAVAFDRFRTTGACHPDDFARAGYFGFEIEACGASAMTSGRALAELYATLLEMTEHGPTD